MATGFEVHYDPGEVRVAGLVLHTWDGDGDDNDYMATWEELWPNPESEARDVKSVSRLRIELPHQCDAWVIGNLKHASRMCKDLKLAVDAYRRLRTKWKIEVDDGEDDE